MKGGDRHLAPGSGTRGRAWGGALAGALEIMWWWGAGVGIWLLTLSSVTAPELFAAIGCGLPCALAARAGRRAVGGQWQPRLAWLAWLPPFAAAVVAGEARVLVLAARRLAGGAEPGGLSGVAMPRDEPAAVAAAHRAAAVMTVSAAPGTFVADADPREDKLVIHTLAGGAPSLHRMVAR